MNTCCVLYTNMCVTTFSKKEWCTSTCTELFVSGYVHLGSWEDDPITPGLQEDDPGVPVPLVNDHTVFESQKDTPIVPVYRRRMTLLSLDCVCIIPGSHEGDNDISASRKDDPVVPELQENTPPRPQSL